jgi:hypothetical protein
MERNPTAAMTRSCARRSTPTGGGAVHSDAGGGGTKKPRRTPLRSTKYLIIAGENNTLKGCEVHTFQSDVWLDAMKATFEEMGRDTLVIEHNPQLIGLCHDCDVNQGSTFVPLQELMTSDQPLGRMGLTNQASTFSSSWSAASSGGSGTTPSVGV